MQVCGLFSLLSPKAFYGLENCKKTMEKIGAWKKSIAEAYLRESRDWDEFFRILIKAAGEIGIENTLAIWEETVWLKRRKWLDANINSLKLAGSPVKEGFRVFYETYLSIHPNGRDGEVVEMSDRKIVSRWWNKCPVLEYCGKYGLDTRLVCRKVYHRPSQWFFKRVNSKLNFDRNYDKIRPHAAYCEEKIWVDE
jgi:hypothetical protein